MPHFEIHGNDVDGFKVTWLGIQYRCGMRQEPRFDFERQSVAWPAEYFREWFRIRFELEGEIPQPPKPDPAQTDEGVWLH
jgi:hypothetical protein